METLQNLKNELQQEYQTTKRFIENYPEGKNDYAPHEKSMKLMPLATHIVEILGWPEIILNTEKLDFAAGDYQPANFTTKDELMQRFEADYAKSKNALDSAKEEDLDGRWSMNMGEKVLADYSKYGAIRHALNQLTHHRAQLGVYYRLNEIPVPGSYGPSADEQNF